MKIKQGIMIAAFTALSILAFVIPSLAQIEKVGCYSMDGKTFHKCGESWTETHNGVVYDCKCNCPARGDDCKPRPIPNTSSQGSTQNQTPSTPTTTNIKVEPNPFGNDDIGIQIKGGVSAISFDGNNDPVIVLKDGSSAGKDEVESARVELEIMKPATMQSVKASIAQRQEGPNLQAQSITRSLKIKAPLLPPPPPPPGKMFFYLQPGDVLLVAPPDTLTFDAWIGHYIRLFDKLSSWEWETHASHCFIYLREVKGVKLFQDNLPGEGFRIKTEDQITEQYAGRYLDVAHPLNKVGANSLWAAAKELGIRQLNADLKKLSEPDLVRMMDKWTNYGLVGDDNLVCSESARFALIWAGLEIKQTDSLLKKLIGIYFGPANFYSDKQNFLIIPLGWLPKRPGK